jgi:hypothetical protein
MFHLKFVLAALSALTLAAAIPAGLAPREDWKTAVGWDGKVSTPTDLDPSNVSKPTPGVSTSFPEQLAYSDLSSVGTCRDRQQQH